MNQNQQSDQDTTLPQNNPVNLTPVINQPTFQAPPPNPFNNQQMNQRFQQQQPIMFGEEPQIFQKPQVRLNDDDELNLSEQKIEQNESTYDLENNLTLEIKTSYQQGKLYDSNIQYLPGMISLKTKDEELKPGKQSRVGVDLICLIDKSGSMQGEKIKMVLDSLNILLDFLTEKDRLQLISFNSQAERLTPLKKMNDLNKEYMKKVISDIKSSGGTTISEATKIAFDQIQTRKQRNHVTSIFLLSDGQDSEAERRVNAQFQQIDEVFTIHSFGFGSDHDAKMMTAISDLGKGGFYFVQNISLLDEFFVDALGELVSVVGADIQIEAKCQPAAPYQDIQISKTYSKQWQTVQKNKEYKIEIPQIPSGSRKDFVFELQLPKFTEQINDQNRNALLMQVNVKLKNSKTGQIIQKAAELTLTFFNQNEQLINNEPDIDVLVQYYRVKATEVIEEANRKCSQNRNEEAQQMLEDIFVTIKGNAKVAEKSQGILEDLRQAKQGSNRRQYQDYGQKQMMQMCSNNYQQKGINSNFNQHGMQVPQYTQQTFQNQMQYGFTQMRQESKRS